MEVKIVDEFDEKIRSEQMREILYSPRINSDAGKDLMLAYSCMRKAQSKIKDSMRDKLDSIMYDLSLVLQKIG